jgi:hypothetical protein
MLGPAQKVGCMCVCVCVCVCVCAAAAAPAEAWVSDGVNADDATRMCMAWLEGEAGGVCVCVCVCVSEFHNILHFSAKNRASLRGKLGTFPPMRLLAGQFGTLPPMLRGQTRHSLFP